MASKCPVLEKTLIELICMYTEYAKEANSYERSVEYGYKMLKLLANYGISCQTCHDTYMEALTYLKEIEHHEST